MEWPVEDIPDGDALFCRVHYRNIDSNGDLIPGAFRNNPDKDPSSGMSVNWEKYSTAEQTRKEAPQPEYLYAIVKLNAGAVRQVPRQTVVHEPLPHNRSHSEIFGVKKTEERVKLMEIYEYVIHIDPSLITPTK